LGLKQVTHGGRKRLRKSVVRSRQWSELRDKASQSRQAEQDAESAAVA